MVIKTLFLLIVTSWLASEFDEPPNTQNPISKAEGTGTESTPSSEQPLATRDDSNFDKFRITYRGISNTSHMHLTPMFEPFRSNLGQLLNAQQQHNCFKLQKTPEFGLLNLGIALDIVPIYEEMECIPELGLNWSILMTDGTKIEYASPAYALYYAELNRQFPGAEFLLVYAPNLASKGASLPTPSVIRGDLFISPGTAYVFDFSGTEKQTKIVRDQPFTLEYFSRKSDKVLLKVQFPMPKLEELTPDQDSWRAATKGQSTYIAILEDDQGKYYLPVLTTDRDAAGHSNFQLTSDGFSGGGSMSSGAPNPTITFQFDPPPKEREIRSIHVTFKDRWRSPEIVPFKLDIK